MAEKTADEIIKGLGEEGAQAVEAFRRDLQKVRTGRATTGLIENVQIEYYGSRMALSHLAQITAPEPHTLVVQPYDTGALSAIEKGIQAANLGLNPSKEANVLRVSVPPLTEDRRKEICKHLHKLAEDFRVSIRTHRRETNDALKSLEKGGALSKDDAKRMLDKVQKQTDEQISKIDSLLSTKEKEVMAV